jgi:hypothetical protein
MSEFFQLLQSNPILGFSGIVASILGFIIGIPLTIYLYRRGNKKRELMYKVHPVRTQIVRAGATSRLSVLHDGQEIKGDITAIHLDIWNRGRESIRQTDMLRPLVIETANRTPILEASVQRVTRDVIELGLDESQCNQGRLGVSWKILEEGDGGIVQIMYAGPSDLQITAHAIPEGQQRGIIDAWAYTLPPISPRPGVEKLLYLCIFLLLMLGVNALIDSYFANFKLFRQDFPWIDFTLLGHVFLLPVIIIFGRDLYLRLRGLRPPFDF